MRAEIEKVFFMQFELLDFDPWLRNHTLVFFWDIRPPPVKCRVKSIKINTTHTNVHWDSEVGNSGH